MPLRASSTSAPSSGAQGDARHPAIVVTRSPAVATPRRSATRRAPWRTPSSGSAASVRATWSSISSGEVPWAFSGSSSESARIARAEPSGAIRPAMCWMRRGGSENVRFSARRAMTSTPSPATRSDTAAMRAGSVPLRATSSESVTTRSTATIFSRRLGVRTVKRHASASARSVSSCAGPTGRRFCRSRFAISRAR